MGAGGQGEVGADQSSAGDRVWMLHWSHFGVPGSIGIFLMLHWSRLPCVVTRWVICAWKHDEGRSVCFPVLCLPGWLGIMSFESSSRWWA